MGNFRMNVGNAEIVALSDMNCAYPTALGELWPRVPAEAWRPFVERYPDTFEGDRMRQGGAIRGQTLLAGGALTGG